MFKKIFPWIVFGALLSLLLNLGFWQLRRAEEKQNLLAHYEVRRLSPPLTTSALPSLAVQAKKLQDEQRFARIELAGQFDAKHAIVLLNKIHEHQLGFQIVMPFFVAGYPQPVLVNLGWVPHPAQFQSKKNPHYYDELPLIPKLKGDYTIQAYVDYPQAGVTVGPAIAGEVTWPLAMTHLDFTEFELAYHRPIAHFILLLDENEKIGFIRTWHPVTISPARHVGYAVQWFALSLTLIAIPLVLRLRRYRKKKVSHGSST